MRSSRAFGSVANKAANSPVLANADATAMAGLKLSYAAEGDTDPYVGFEARVVPENITFLPKTNGGSDWSEHNVVVKKGETVGSILRELGASPEEIKGVIAVLGARAREGGLKEGQKLRVLTAPAGLGHMQPLRIIIAGDNAIEAAVALSDRGTYVPVDIRNINADVTEASQDDSGRRRQRRAALSEHLRDRRCATTFRRRSSKNWFASTPTMSISNARCCRAIRSTSSTPMTRANEGRNEVRYVSLTVGGETKKYYHYQTADDGTYDYYDETGKSAKKFLVRKPVPIGIMRSGFGERNHPLLHYMKTHTGVDWAAPFGTPIFAAGNGEIDEIGLKGGYGKYVRIRHANGYQTAYGHMTAFARGLDVGTRVRQGQIIGFVGSTGLSTGSHVHFEILINDRFVNPMTVKLPRGRVLDGVALALFEKNREQLDALMAHVPGRVAQAR